MDYFAFHRSTTRARTRASSSICSASRGTPGDKFFTERSGYPRTSARGRRTTPEQARRNQHYADIAASIQAVTEELVLNMARAAPRETPARRACAWRAASASTASPTGRSCARAGFEELYVQPAAGDSGGAVGAALYAYHSVLGKPRNFVMEHAFWGQDYPRRRYARSWTASGIPLRVA